MTGYLLDLNVLLAMSWPGHQFHSLAEQWFAEQWFARNSSKGWVLSRLVLCRILSNPAFSPRAVSTKEAMEALTINTRQPKHRF